MAWIRAKATLAAPAAMATAVSVGSQQAITTSGQVFNFSFTGLPTSGTGGQMQIVLNGDYSGFSSESALVTIDIASGSLDLGDTGDGVISNSVAGLSLFSYARTVFSFDDVQHSYVFSLSDGLLGSLIADGTLSATVRNDAGVNPLARNNPDFVRLGFSYESTTVPEPGTLALTGLALVGLPLPRRRRKVP